jgi:hypothetical protein
MMGMANVGSNNESTIALATAADGKSLVITVPCFRSTAVFFELLVALPLSRVEQIRGGSRF